MLFKPTTTVNILRGTGTDDYGDETDAQTVVAASVPAHITEVRKNASTRASGTPRVIRYYACRVPATQDVQVGDRIEDTSTGSLYMIDAFTRPGAHMPVPDLRLDLRRVN